MSLFFNDPDFRSHLDMRHFQIFHMDTAGHIYRLGIGKADGAVPKSRKCNRGLCSHCDDLILTVADYQVLAGLNGSVDGVSQSLIAENNNAYRPPSVAFDNCFRQMQATTDHLWLFYPYFHVYVFLI